MMASNALRRSGPRVERVPQPVADLTWRVTEPGTALSSVALVVMATSGFKLFINLNSLIKLDGYCLLSDALGIPNLQAKAVRVSGRRHPTALGRRGRANARGHAA